MNEDNPDKSGLVQEEILHFGQDDKLTYVIINKRFIINIQPKSVSLSNYLLLRKTKIDNVTPAPASAGVNLSPRKRGAGVQSEKLDSRFRGNDKYGYIRF
ncbi:MAG: hypothetical protein ABIL62_03550 [Planctomycetota bacterium]